MADDEWPNEPDEPDPEPDPEPDEPDPEQRWGDPEAELSTAPDTTRLEEVDVDPELSRLFWAAVVFANIALAGLTVGPMVIFFTGDWQFGGVLMVVGAFSLFRVYQLYREFEQRDFGDDEDESEEPDSASRSA